MTKPDPTSNELQRLQVMHNGAKATPTFSPAEMTRPARTYWSKLSRTCS